jgi:arylsulfatase A-like enzyme
MGYGDVSALNEHCGFKTPAFDDICTHGIAFTDAHASSAVCTPSRYSILTGRYNWRSRLKKYVLGGYSKALIENGRLTLASMLREQGYRTAAIGKWHLGMDLAGDFEEAPAFAPCPGVDYRGKIKNAPVDQGFDYFYGISASLDMPPYIYIENDHFTALPTHDTEGSGKGFWRKGPTAEDFDHREVLPRLTEKALDRIDLWAGSPFFLYFPLPAPHTPILPAPRFRYKSGTNEYGDFVLMCDDVVSQIIQKLKDRGIYENTILLFTSDNGCSPEADFEELARKGHNPSYHFRGHKADIYEGGHRIPLVVQWPQVIPPGERCGQTVCLSDIMATMAACLGLTLPENAGEDSISNLPLWKNPQGDPVRTETVHQSIDGSLSIRRGDWKLEMCPGSGGWSPPKPGEEPEGAPRFQLYNLGADIGEQRNLINEHPRMSAELRARLTEIVRLGRSTPGAPQPNTGAPLWDAVRWLEEA